MKGEKVCNSTIGFKTRNDRKFVLCQNNLIILLQERFDSSVVKRGSSLFSSFCSNVAKQVARFYRSFRWLCHQRPSEVSIVRLALSDDWPIANFLIFACLKLSSKHITQSLDVYFILLLATLFLCLVTPWQSSPLPFLSLASPLTNIINLNVITNWSFWLKAFRPFRKTYPDFKLKFTYGLFYTTLKLNSNEWQLQKKKPAQLLQKVKHLARWGMDIHKTVAVKTFL